MSAHVSLPGTDARKRTRARRERHGRHAEWLAAAYLRLAGYQILARRLKTKLGEIDLVVRRGDLLIAVEVKARGDVDAALEAVTWRQRQRIERCMTLFLQRRTDLRQCSLRFDVFIVRPWRRPVHLRDAWRPS
ncbi:MAG: YraN family protein [Geminicoccaceae bacterium]